jgi:hypothetical protein
MNHPFMQLLNIKHDLSAELFKFKSDDMLKEFSFSLNKPRLPYITQDKKINITGNAYTNNCSYSTNASEMIVTIILIGRIIPEKGNKIISFQRNKLILLYSQAKLRLKQDEVRKVKFR